MYSVLFGFQIFITILIAIVIVFQKSSSDGIVSSNIGNQLPSNSQTSFISKFTIFLVFVFMANSLILAKDCISRYQREKSIINALENEPAPLENDVSDQNVPKME
ncbi:preprotein translocase subunit SecG [Candidatus Bandiella euplotis]|uniref:Protein-export membrane protein SecG n=1 Tax=Candidatus Bandiella euplotis TaxID=1664265 RepID=A0ABZ0UMK7_9RICK|nr:preprotein translocase subunit SecG [Candidatus Bandiella woodruffii]